jgi:Flp pilus assembly CpaF family ATPase
VAIHHLNQEATSRGARMLRTALGPAIALWLEDPSVVEVMLNPDGRLWIDRLAGGLIDTGEHLSPGDGERIVRLVAHHVGAEVHPGSPRVSAELPETGERFEGLLPPVVAAPAFAIRKPAVAVFTLDDYAAAGIMSSRQAETLRTAVADRRNILVAGGTSTGKTTLTNALLAEVAKTTDRVVLIEDSHRDGRRDLGEGALFHRIFAFFAGFSPGAFDRICSIASIMPSGEKAKPPAARKAAQAVTANEGRGLGADTRLSHRSRIRNNRQ